MHPLSRRGFLGWAGAAGLLSLFPPMACLPKWRRARAEGIVGKEYIAKGIVAMAEAHRFHWAAGHHGAAIIAAYFFCRENPLDERTLLAVRGQMDAFLAFRRKYFPEPTAAGRGRADPDRIARTLERHVAEFRKGGCGHDAIFASLALKGLRDLPDLASPDAVDGICRMIGQFQEGLPVEVSAYDQEHPLPPYQGEEDIAEAAADALLRLRSHFVEGTETSVANAVHWITHADALITLHELGYGEVARRGYRAHQQHINHPVREADGRASAPPDAPGIPGLLAAEYWESGAPKDTQGDNWFYGHSFKFPYSLFRVLGRVDDPAKRALCLDRAYAFSAGTDAR